MPIAPGIPRENVQNTIALEYGTEESLKVIEKLLPEIAGIMVEPVQARRPDSELHRAEPRNGLESKPI